MSQLINTLTSLLSQRSSEDPADTAARALAELNQIRARDQDEQVTEEQRDEFVQFAFGGSDRNDEDEDDDEDDDEDNEDDEEAGAAARHLLAEGATIGEILKAHIDDKTRQGYQRLQRKFVLWIFQKS